MTQTTASQNRTPQAGSRDIERWHARRRWARAGLVYAALLFFAIVFIGPLLFATVSSLKVDPLEYPPTLEIPQLSPENWAGAARLGAAGTGDRWFGGFASGADVPFEITYFVPEGVQPVLPEPEVPRRRPGAGLGAVLDIEYASDYATLTPVEVVDSREGSYVVDEETLSGRFISYGFEIRYPGTGPEVDRLPLDVLTPREMIYVDSTISASRLERRGRVASFDNVAPGVLGFVFHNYVRVFKEARSVTSGQSLFLAWTGNSALYAAARVITNLLFAAMAGYGLARLRFPGKNLIFVLVLFSQMIPGQVTFISNYLVLRDGIFGLTGLFGVDTLLNSLWDVIIGGAGSSALIEASKVFIMKQFFESIPHDVEEAAMIDGANQWQRYWNVVLPMARPALGAVAILTFQGAWNDFFWPLVVLTTPEDIKTLPIGLLTFRNAYGSVGDWGLILAGAVMSAVPIIIIFFVFQKYFLEGVSFGGSKE